MTAPKISVVIPTYNRRAQLEQVLLGFGAQDTPASDIEIIVVSDGSTDGTDEQLLAGRAPVPVNVIQQANQGPAVARNAGVAAATGDLILFIDDDVVAEPECVAVHLRAHEQTDGETVVIGPLLTPETWELEPWVQWEQNMLYKQYDAMARGDWEPTARQFYTGNASLARDRFLESGGFDASFRRGEDVELAYRLNDTGMAFAFDPAARAFHHARRSYESWLSNASSYGRNDAMLWRDSGQAWLIPTIRAEYYERNPFTRIYTRLGLGVPVVGDLVSRLGPRVAKAVAGFVPGRIGQQSLSAVYNLAYYRGVVDELGGLDSFMAVEPVAAHGSLEFHGSETRATES